MEWTWALNTKILIIDDDSAITDLVKMMLAAGPFDVSAFHSSTEGIDAIQRSQPDVVILDLLMPGEDGWLTCKEIRRFSQVPILVMSALDNPGIHVKVLEVGADDFLVKPVSKPMLVAHLKKLAWRSRVNQQPLRSNLPA
jgi:DNA-binding response OmpR family regulator